MLIAEDEKIICEITKDNQTVIEERYDVISICVLVSDVINTCVDGSLMMCALYVYCWQSYNVYRYDGMLFSCSNDINM